MANRGENTYREILSQPDVWAQLLQALTNQTGAFATAWNQAAFDRVILTGCGSTYYAAMVGASLLRAHGVQAAESHPASELMHHPQRYFSTSANTALIAVSRSGTTRETLAAVANFRTHGGGKVFTVTCHSESDLATASDVVLHANHAREQSRVQTRSFSSMVLLLQAMALTLAGKNADVELGSLPHRLESLLDLYARRMRDLGANAGFTQTMFLGSGALYGLACEAMLKMLEMTRLPCSAFHTLEYLHSPKYAVDERTLVIGLMTDALVEEETRTLEDATRRGATLLTITERNSGQAALGHVVELNSGLPMTARLILYLPLLQLLGYHQSMARGLDPDNLEWLTTS